MGGIVGKIDLDHDVTMETSWTTEVPTKITTSHHHMFSSVLDNLTNLVELVRRLSSHLIVEA